MLSSRLQFFGQSKDGILSNSPMLYIFVQFDILVWCTAVANFLLMCRKQWSQSMLWLNSQRWTRVYRHPSICEWICTVWLRRAARLCTLTVSLSTTPLSIDASKCWLVSLALGVHRVCFNNCINAIFSSFFLLLSPSDTSRSLCCKEWKFHGIFYFAFQNSNRFGRFFLLLVVLNRQQNLFTCILHCLAF